MKMSKSVILVVFLILFVSLCAEAPEWEVIPGTQYSMQVYSHVEFMAQFFTNSNPENIVAAFGPGGENDCRAIAYWNEYNQYQLWYMTIVSNAEPEDYEIITYKIYDAAGDQVLDSRESSMFADNIVIGSYDDTFLLTIPYVIDDLYGAYEDSLLTILPESGVLINDFISEEYIDEFWVVLDQDVAHGVLNFFDDGSFDYLPELNFNGSDFFEYYATDGDYITGNAVVELQVQPVNDPPDIDLPDEGFTFPEDTTFQVDFTSYITDIDNAVLTLTYSGNDYIQVTVVGYNVTFIPEENFFGTEYIHFTINDNTARAIDSETIPVIVTPVNDPPTLDSPIADFSFNEDQVDTHLNLNEVFSDIDDYFLVFNVIYNINLNVIIDEYGLVTISSYQQNWNGSETIVFSASDYEYTVYDTVTVTVLPVNDPPYIVTELPDLELAEDFEDISVNLDEHFDDIDDNTLYYSAQFNNNHVLIGIAQNLMTIYSVPNWTGITQVVISAQDDFNFRYTVRDTFLITVNPVNDPPVLLSPLPDLQMLEDAAPVQRNLNNYFIDYDGDILDYTVDFVDTEMNAWIEYNVLYFQPVANWFGYTSITVTAADQYSYISDTFDVEVIAVNDAPFVYMPIPDMMLEENFQSFDLNLYDYFDDIDSDILYFSASLSVYNSVVVSIVDEIMTISALPQWNGLVNVTVTAQDDISARLTASDIFTIEVIPTNDPPYLISTIDDYNLNEDFVPVTIDLSQYFADPENDPITYTAAYDDNQIGIVINGDIMTISPVFNWNGTAPVTVYASDEMPLNDPASDQFNVIVQPVNDPPILAVPIDDYNVLEDFDPFTIDLNQHFLDYDDILNFSVDYDADLIQMSIYMGILTIDSLPDVFGDTEVTVTAGDGHRVQVSDNFWVYIAPVNDQPVIMLPPSFEFYEDTSLELDFANYIEDIDTDILTLTAEGNTNVLIDINVLMVTFSNTLNWNGSEVITFHVYDGEFTVSDEVLVVVIPQADVLTLNLPPTFTFNEDQSLIVNFAPYISNPDGFSLELSYEGADWVTVNIYDLTVTFGAYPDWNGADMITFTVSNLYGQESSSDIVNVIVIPVNDPPTVTPIPDQFILEDSGTFSINLNEYFYDVDGNILQYSAIFDDGALQVEVIYPNLYFESLLNWYGTTTIVVTAQDVYRYTVRDTFDVIVDPVNDAPHIVTYFNDRTKNEDFLPFTVDFTGYFDDVDNETLYYSVDYDYYSVYVVLTGTTLEISSALNWNGVTTISVTASDMENRLSVTDEFLLTVNSVNDPPQLVLPFEDLTLPEDFDSQYIDLSYHFYDPDNTLTYSVYADAGEIEVSIIYGNMLRLDSVNDWYGTTTVEVVANDLQNRAIASDEFDVLVEPVNDPPIVQVTLEDMTIDEDTVSDPVDLNMHFFDVDGDILTYSAQVSDPNGIVIIEENTMTVTAAENWFGPFDVYITADDLHNRATVTDNFHVVVMPVNDAPFIVTPMEDLIFSEDFEPYTYNLSQNYDDIECDFLYYNAEYNSDNIALALNASIMQINSIDDWFGTTQVILFISDQLCREVITDTFLVTVNPLNDPPYVANPIPNQTKYEDFVTFSLDLNMYFADLDEDILSYSAVANDTIVTLDVQYNLLYISSVLNLNGYVDIIVTADDGFNRLTASDTFTLNVIPVNDPPILMLPDQFDFDEDTILVIDLIDTGFISDIDNDPEDLELNASGGINVITVIEGIVVTFSATDNWFGQEEIVFSLSDETRYVVFDIVTVIVNPVNDPPYFVFAIPDQQILEGNLFNPINLDYYVTDVDDPDPTLVWNYSGNVNLVVDINPVTHIATVSAPYPDWNGNENITFTVTDSYYESVSDVVNFEIIPVNDPPVVTVPIPDQYVEINFAPFYIDLMYHFYDIDSDQLTYQVNYNPDEITVSEQYGMLTISSIVNWYGISEVIVTADDNITRATVSDTFLVDITYTITQTMDLGMMWNWISFYVQPEDYSLSYVFGPLGDNVNTVKYQTQSADYVPDYSDWFGDLEAIQDGGGYLVNVTDPVPGFSLSGNRIMSDTPIDMIADWNWIAYYPPSEDSLTSALYSILDNVHIVKNQTQSAEYFPEVGNGIWFGDLMIMAPGIGYKVRMINPDILVYPLYPVIMRNQNNHALSLPDNAPDDWTIMPGTSDNMIMMMSADYNGEIFDWAEGRAIGIFDADNICRAHGIWQEADVLEQGFWYFTIVGNNNGTPLYIDLLDENGNESVSLDMITFHPDSKVGTPFEPYQVTFYPVEDDNDQITPLNRLSQNYPNPFNPETTISFSLAENDIVELTIFNLRGEKIRVLVREQREAGSYSIIWDGSDDNGNKVASGIYFYSLNTSQYSATRKMVMIK